MLTAHLCTQAFGHQKNDLGAMCLISGIYFSWKYLQCRASGSRFKDSVTKQDIIIIVMIALVTAYV